MSGILGGGGAVGDSPDVLGHDLPPLVQSQELLELHANQSARVAEIAAAWPAPKSESGLAHVLGIGEEGLGSRLQSSSNMVVSSALQTAAQECHQRHCTRTCESAET